MLKVKPTITPVRIGWFEWDGDKAVIDGKSIPCLWQRCQTREDRYTYEGVIPLKNGASMWLFGERITRTSTWEITTALFLACPLHPRDPDPARCEYAAVKYSKRPRSVTQTAGCGGAACVHCTHLDMISGDPGDPEEFWSQMEDWSSLRVINNRRVSPHQDCYNLRLLKETNDVRG